MKRWQKTITCPKCGTGNVLKARQLVSGNIKFDVDSDKIRCRNCGSKMRSVPLPYPFGK